MSGKVTEASLCTNYYSEDELGRISSSLAQSSCVQLLQYSAGDPLRRQDTNRQMLRRAYLSCQAAASDNDLTTPAAEWLLDNFYLIEETIRQLRRDLPARFYQQLPTVQIEGADKAPRVMALMWLFVSHSHAEVTRQRLTAVVHAYQTVLPFQIAELWAIPSFLRLVLMEELKHVTGQIDLSHRMRGRANQVADALVLADSQSKYARCLAECESLLSNGTFASQLVYRLREGPAETARALDWLETRLASDRSDTEEVLINEQNRLSWDNVRIGNIVRSLRTIDDINWTTWFTRVSVVDARLRDDSSFSELDFNSQDRYRKAIERLARSSRHSELEVTESALTMYRDLAAGSEAGNADVSHFLIGLGRPALEAGIGFKPSATLRIKRAYKRLGWWSIAGPVLALTVAALVAVFMWLMDMGVSISVALALALLAALPASDAAFGFFNTFVAWIKTPNRIVGFEFKDGVPESAKTLVVIPCLISSHDTVDDLVRNLEVHYLANTRGEIYFALLSDWPDAEHEKSARDAELLDYARSQIDSLARRYAHDGRTRFFLLHRRRTFNPVDDIWMGWERKRGKLMELNLLLRGDQDTTYVPLPVPLPVAIKYVVTLDADTRLTRDAVTKLVGKMAHPLNRPVPDADGGRICRGYAILQPRVTPSLTTGEESSVFQRVFSQNRGLDPYVFTVSDVYQDLTGEGSFTGKGIYDVDALTAMLKDRFPDNTVLSHDLLESSFARSGLATDVELIEDFPVRFEVETSRQHRWVRGDWQLLPFILDLGNGLSALARWKLIDNLRRSLIPGAWLMATVIGWCVLPLPVALPWQAALVISLFVAPTLSLLRDLMPAHAETILRTRMFSLYSEIVSATAQVLLRIIFLPHSAVMAADAAVRSLYRLYFSRKLLLQWQTAQQAGAMAHHNLPDYFVSMSGSLLLTVTVLVAIPLVQPELIVLALPFCFFWLLAPAFAWLVSQPAQNEDRLDVSPAHAGELRCIARRTWRYFEHFVTESHSWLPPDNFQETPEPVVANRTSPTNIGVYLLSIISARDFGWIGMEQTVTRLERTLATVATMTKYRGHLYNWYDTHTLETLLPRYVSSVDSGNLAGHLTTVASACRQWAEAPYAYLQAGFDGIGDAAGIMREELEAVAGDRRIIRPLRRRLEEQLDGLIRALDSLDAETEFASARLSDLGVAAADIEKLAGELDHEIGSDASRSMRGWGEALHVNCLECLAETALHQADVEVLRGRLDSIATLARTLAFEMDFSFLMREDRRLLAIGFRPDEGALDEACYDLLASEARLTSLFAIAKGDLPTEHWFRLGRSVTQVGSLGALISWSGSMFEYLMPPLVMREQQGSILNQTNNLIVRRQIEYGRKLGIPWGISEAAFNARDRQMTYQYSNFGVPSLGMKRGLAKDLVVAPYATLLASQYYPGKAVLNLRRLKALGARGPYGFYDAVDFTPSRLPANHSSVVVRNYMAHHHGMSILAVANVVFQGRLRERFHSDPVIESAELLLQEKAPREVPLLALNRAANDPVSGRSELTISNIRVVQNPVAADREIALLSNGHYSVMLAATGAGYANWNGLAVTRFKPDPVEESWGTFIFLRDLEDGHWWSGTSTPRQAVGEQTQTVFSDSQAEFHKTVGSIHSRIDVVVATAIDAEGRRLTLTNLGQVDRLIEVTSYCEPVIAAVDADTAHPLFSKMFIHTEIAGDCSAIFAFRNKRSPSDPDMHLAHLVADTTHTGRNAQAETSRRNFIGRARTLSDAAAFDAEATLSGKSGFTLDPIFALRRTVRVPAGKETVLAFWTIAAPSRPELDTAVAQYAHLESFEREAMHAWTRSQVQWRHLEMAPDEATVFQRLARYLVYPDTDLRHEARPDRQVPQSTLWGQGISGDYPIIVLRIDAPADIEIARKALRAQAYLRARGLAVDLVILNEQSSSYSQDLQNAIDALCEIARRRMAASLSGEHLFALRRDLMPAAVYGALLSTGRAVFHARNGKFSTQIERALALRQGLAEAAERTADNAAITANDALSVPHAGPSPTRMPGIRRSDLSPHTASDAQRGAGLSFWNGLGGFSVGTREYVIRLRKDDATPQPWINVVSNARFGFHVSADGAGFTWSANSRDYQLTPWSNDPVIDRPGEGFYIRDLDTEAVISPMPAFDSARRPTYEARFGMGYCTFKNEMVNLSVQLRQTVDANDPVKLSQLRIQNTGSKRRHFRVYAYVEWVLGNDRSKTALHLALRVNRSPMLVTARNPYSVEFGERTAVFACSRSAGAATVSRREFLGSGNVWRPDAVYQSLPLSGTADSEGDPCAALSIDITVEAGATEDVVFLLGEVPPGEKAEAFVARQFALPFDSALAGVSRQWQKFLARVHVQTPDPAMNVMLNTWLPYQALACRIHARSGFYQASGAYGFRDQLQDTLAFLLHDPGLARTQIINAAGRQFARGDVQHWWLPGRGAGVRTMISDDVVWLGYAVARYVSVTGDRSILDVPIPFIEGPELEPGHHDAFYQPKSAESSATIYEHSALALNLAIERTGANGLPLILGGDWNDGMNRVGIAGRGESVWLGWFLASVLKAFIPLAESRADTVRRQLWTDNLTRLLGALETAGWDGSYYRRGYYDDGSPLGSASGDECRIDSIAQSWSVLSGLADPAHSASAIESVLDQLVDHDAGLVKLFTPPLSRTPQDPGYIKAYPPGVRENGGQYTHAATWLVAALANMGRGDEAHACFNKLNPITHALDYDAAQIYRVEPYVIAADIYSYDDLAGRGGWTWYTGSAGWLYRAGVENILGIRQRDGELVFSPSLPASWPGYRATVTIDGVIHQIEVVQHSAGDYSVTVNDEAVEVVAPTAEPGAFGPARDATPSSMAGSASAQE